MANLTPVSGWDDVYQIEVTDTILGGAGQKANEQAQDLLNRTQLLRDEQFPVRDLSVAVIDELELVTTPGSYNLTVGGSGVARLVVFGGTAGGRDVHFQLFFGWDGAKWRTRDSAIGSSVWTSWRWFNDAYKIHGIDVSNVDPTDGQTLVYDATPGVEKYVPGTGGSTLPSGTIIMWYGDVASIPAGWKVCDGTAGTPNLQGKIPAGQVGSSAPTYINSSEVTPFASTNSATSGTHNHGGATGGANGMSQFGAAATGSGWSTSYAGLHTHGISSDPGGSHSHTYHIPYFRVHFIMKD